MKPGEISGIVQVDDKFIIMYLESFTKPMAVTRDEVRGIIYEDIHEKKARMAMAHEFDRLKDSARIDNYLTGKSQSPQRIGATAGGPHVAQPGLARTRRQPRSGDSGGVSNHRVVAAKSTVAASGTRNRQPRIRHCCSQIGHSQSRDRIVAVSAFIAVLAARIRANSDGLASCPCAVERLSASARRGYS